MAEYRDLPIEQLVESATNPRTRYQRGSLEELAPSFRSRGVLEPLVVGQSSWSGLKWWPGHTGTVQHIAKP